MEGRLFEDLVVSRGGPRRVQAGGMPVSFALHAAGITGLLALSLAVPEKPPAPAPPRITDVGWLPRVGSRVPAPARHSAVARNPRGNRRAATPVVEIPVDVPIEPEPFAPEDATGCVGCMLRGGPGGDPSDERGGGDDEEGRGSTRLGNDPVRVGGHIQAPRKMRHADPVYPELAKQARVAATVILECVIGRDGRVQRVTVLRGHPLFDAAAVDAVRQWTYHPTRLNGIPVEIVMTVTVRFTPR
jgi:periplasmic protein TonB